MTIAEAVQLIIHTGSLAVEGEGVFVLEMGEPVRIMELAETMICLSGLEPERDIAIEVIGRRPGEKLHEQLFNPYEESCATSADRILQAQSPPLDPDWVGATFDQINLMVLAGDAPALAKEVAELAQTRAIATLDKPA
jgi:FlaA1/EpsC-like NDP-sugar epimerase